MTKYLEPSFSTMAPPGQEYRDNFDRIFGKKTESFEEIQLTDEEGRAVRLVSESTGSCEPPSPAEALARAVEAEFARTSYPDPRLGDIISALRAYRFYNPRYP